MTEEEINKELYKQIDEYFHMMRTKNFKKNVADALERGRQMDIRNNHENR